MNLQLIDWIIIFLVPISALVLANQFKKRYPQKNRRNYFIANRNLSGVATASTYIGANITFTSIFIILSQEGYKRGIVVFAVPIFWMAGTIIFIFLYPRIKNYIIQGMTLHQTIGDVFKSSSLKFYASLWTILAFVFTVGLEFYGGIKLISAANVPLLSYLSITLIFIVIIAFFTTRGGFGGVAWADIALDLFTLVGTAILITGIGSFVISLILQGANVYDSTKDLLPALPTFEDNVTFIIGMFILFIPFQFCTFDSWQRLSARKNTEKSPNLLLITSSILVSICFCVPIVIGIYVRSKGIFVDIKGGALVLFEYLKNIEFAPILIGLIFAGFIAAIFSTADELLNCCSFSFLSDALDIPRTTDLNDKQSELRIIKSAKLYVVIFSICSALFAFAGIWFEKEITDVAIAVFSAQIVFIIPLYFVFFKQSKAEKYSKAVKLSMIFSFLGSFVIVILGWFLKDKSIVESAPIGALLLGIVSFQGFRFLR